MRLFVLGLVVANAAFFSWRFNEQVEAKIKAARPVTPLSSNAPTLQLVNELDELPPQRDTARKLPVSTAAAAQPAASAPLADEPASETAVADADADTALTPPTPADGSATARGMGAPSGVCVHIGPFPTPADYSGLQQWLAPRATALKLETTSTDQRRLFWVYLEPSSATEAQQKIADLKRQGVSDYLLINRNGLKNAISLGVFSSQDAVNRRLAEMTKKGYKPLVVPKVETTDMHWLNAEFATGYANTGDIPGELRGNAGIENIDCQRLAGNPPDPPKKA